MHSSQTYSPQPQVVGQNGLKPWVNMGTETNKEERNSVEYLAQLLKDKKQIQAFPNVFVHLERLLDEEISKVRVGLFHLNGTTEPLALPCADGPVVQISEKVWVPVKDHPDFNFVGRILGPQGHTIKELEKSTGCRIMVRGRGSMRDKLKEEQYRGKPNWEHLCEDLHVLIQVEDAKNRAEIKLSRAVTEVKKLLVPAIWPRHLDSPEEEIPILPVEEVGRMKLLRKLASTQPEGEDSLKKIQLMELAVINGTYRDPKTLALAQQAAAGRAFDPTTGLMLQQHALRTQTPAGAPLFLAPRLPGAPQLTAGMNSHLMNGGPPPPLISPSDVTGAGLQLYNPMSPYADFPFASFSTPSAALLEYPGVQAGSTVGAVPKVRTTHTVTRTAAHPYARVTLA